MSRFSLIINSKEEFQDDMIEKSKKENVMFGCVSVWTGKEKGKPISLQSKAKSPNVLRHVYANMATSGRNTVINMWSPKFWNNHGIREETSANTAWSRCEDYCQGSVMMLDYPCANAQRMGTSKRKAKIKSTFQNGFSGLLIVYLRI